MINRASHHLDLRRSSLKVATSNVLTLSKEGCHVSGTRKLSRLNVDIACLTEARLVGSGEQVVEEHTLIHSGGADHHKGVCLVLTSKASHALTLCIAVSDRLLTARFTHRHGHLTVNAVYAPTEKSTTADKDDFGRRYTLGAAARPAHCCWWFQCSLRYWPCRVRAGGWPIWFWCSQRQHPEITNLLFRSWSVPLLLLISSSRHQTLDF